MRRDLSLSPRVEEKRELKVIELPAQFSLKEIKEHFEESLNEVKAQYPVADLLNKNGNENDGNTILRSQVVLAEGLLDFFIHEMSKFCLFKMFTGQWSKSEKYYRFMVPMSKVEDAINTANSKDWFFDYLNDRFSRDVFLSHESMKDQLNLIGVDFSKTMKRAFSKESDNPLQYGKQVVIDLFQRRNDIAHQNDRSHASAKKQDITKEFVEKYITNIELIVNAIYDIALDNDIIK